ncbi:MAG TPA: class I SAM-dependent methyltransferase, partial [Blastocatellia bacterium]|nr:class I SAM-dependent methyltransferase [Blastocatellia bacterium]
EAAWNTWVAQRDAEIRDRLTRGDEDSIVNFLLFGTTFTRQPRATPHDIAKLGDRANVSEILAGRIEDMVAGIAAPGTNERLQFARQVVERRGIDPSTAAGKDQVRAYLVETLRRVLAEIDSFRKTIQSAKLLGDPSAVFAERSTLYRERGLSSDTSIYPDFALEQSLDEIRAKGLLAAGSVRRVAIVGPGLDFTDKGEGYDFYPQQTIQPFAVIDSLMRLGLAKPDALTVTTYDLSPRINQHLAAARERARAGTPYVVQLPRDTETNWEQPLIKYWERFGDRIGVDVKTPAPVVGIESVRMRAIRIRPAIVLSITPQDLNVVLQRPEGLAPGDRYDLIIATNILVYYDVFEQSLALVNVSKMLRPGGFLLSNNALFELPSTPMRSAGYTTAVYSDKPDDGDHIVWYQRQP